MELRFCCVETTKSHFCGLPRPMLYVALLYHVHPAVFTHGLEKNHHLL